MEKIAAKILSCELEKNNDGKSTAIKIFVSYGFQQYLHIPNEVDFYKFLDFFEVYKLSDVANKHCYLIMESWNNVVELQQFPHYGDLILSLRTGEIISEFERKEKLAKQEKWKIELDREIDKMQQEQNSPKFIRKEILKLFKQPYSNNNGLFKSHIYSWFNDSPKKLVEKEFRKLLKEKKIIGWGNTRAKRYANARNYRKLCKIN